MVRANEGPKRKSVENFFFCCDRSGLLRRALQLDGLENANLNWTLNACSPRIRTPSLNMYLPKPRSSLGWSFTEEGHRPFEGRINCSKLRINAQRKLGIISIKRSGHSSSIPSFYPFLYPPLLQPPFVSFIHLTLTPLLCQICLPLFTSLPISTAILRNI